MKTTFFKALFQEHYQSVKQFGSRSGPTYGGPDLGLNRFQKTKFAAGRQRVNTLRVVTIDVPRPLSNGLWIIILWKVDV